MFRNLMPHEIEVRVHQCKEKGCSLLLYKDARCDMSILDETVGALNWKREHSRDNKNCTVSLYNSGLKEWVSKEDTGSESNTEAQKGLASDSFKRACFNWGIGRELYSSPFIWVNLKPDQVSQYNGKFRLSFGVNFKVSKIVASSDKHIEFLQIVDNNNNIVFTYGHEPSIKWYVNEELKKLESSVRQDYIDRIKAKQIEVNEDLLLKLKGSF